VDMAIHDFDMARFVLGQEVVEISSYARVLVADRGEADADADADADVAITTLVFESGALGVIENCRQSSPGYDQRVEIHGRAGTLSVDNQPRHGLVHADSAGSHRQAWPHFFADRYTTAYAAELDAFVAEVRHRRGGPAPAGPPGVAATGDDAVRALELSFAADRSARQRQPVVLPLDRSLE